MQNREERGSEAGDKEAMRRLFRGELLRVGLWRLGWMSRKGRVGEHPGRAWVGGVIW